MIDSKITSIIFDYGGVLINLDYQATVDSFKKLGITDFDKIYTQAEQSDLFNKIETGKISSSYFVNQLLDFLPKGTSPNDVVRAWNAMIKNVPLSSIDLIHDLKRKGYRVFLLSNTNQLHIDVADKEWKKVSSESPKELFDSVYYSHEIKLRKPNREIFEFVCAINELEVEKTLFIDDSIQHIVGAKKIGLQTIHLKDGMTVQSIFS